MITIREFTSGDYLTLAALLTAVDSVRPQVANALRARDEGRSSKLKARRWLAEVDGQIAGVGEYSQDAMFFDPHRFGIYVAVHPARQRQGVGKALYEQVMTALEAFEPTEFTVYTYPDQERALRFLTDRDFVEMGRMMAGTMQLADFDMKPHRALFERLVREGVTIKSLLDLRHDPIMDRRLYDLAVELNRDIPTGSPVTLDLDAWQQVSIDTPNLLPAGYLVALHGGGYVGMCTHWKNDETTLAARLTGVKHDYRRRGIGLALKIRGFMLAREQGYTTIVTWNEVRNEAIMSLNSRLGFVYKPGRVFFKKTVTPALETH